MAPQPCKAKLEDVWRWRLEEAAKRHKLAEATRLKVLNERTTGLTVPSDGPQSVKQATLEENAAREEHLKILETFTDLVLRRKVPSE